MLRYPLTTQRYVKEEQKGVCYLLPKSLSSDFQYVDGCHSFHIVPSTSGDECWNDTNTGASACIAVGEDNWMLWFEAYISLLELYVAQPSEIVVFIFVDFTCRLYIQ